jgi:hypothetical protein
MCVLKNYCQVFRSEPKLLVLINPSGTVHVRIVHVVVQIDCCKNVSMRNCQHKTQSRFGDAEKKKIYKKKNALSAVLCIVPGVYRPFTCLE